MQKQTILKEVTIQPNQLVAQGNTSNGWKIGVFPFSTNQFNSILSRILEGDLLYCRTEVGLKKYTYVAELLVYSAG